MSLDLRFTLAAFVASALTTLPACSKSEDDAIPNPVTSQAQAQAAQSSLAAAQSAHSQHVHADEPMPDSGGGAVRMAMPDNDGGAAPMAMPAASAADAPMNMPGASSPAATGMARLLGQPPAMGPGAGGGLPAAMGAPHLYHLGAETFFIDQAAAVGATPDQQSKLTAIKEKALLAYTTAQRKVDQAEQDLWALTSAERPDGAKIEATIVEIGRLQGKQRMEYVRGIGEAVSVLTDAQRKAVVAQSPAPMQSGAMPSAATPPPMKPGMKMGEPSPSSGGMGMGPPKGMGMGGMKPPNAGSMGSMADGGSSRGGMGPM
jgi:hypothetical protein